MDNFKNVFSSIKKIKYILTDKQKRGACALLLVVVLGSFFELLGVTAVLPFVEAVTNPEQLLKNQYVFIIYQKLGLTTNKQLLLLMGVGIIFIYIIKNIYLTFDAYVVANYSSKVCMELSDRMLQSILVHPYEYFVETNSAHVLRGCTTDTGSVFQIISCLVQIVAELINVLLISIFLLYTDFKIAISVILLMMFTMILMILVLKPIFHRIGIKHLDIATAKNKIIYQITNGIKDIFVTGSKEYFRKEYSIKLKQNSRIDCKNKTLSQVPDRIVEGVCISGIIGIVCIRLVTDDSEMISFIPKLAAFAVSAFKIFPSVGKITSRTTSISFEMAPLENVYKTMREAESYTIEMDERMSRHPNFADRHIELKEKIELKHIWWKYLNQKEPVLTDVSFAIDKGESIGLIGPSGSGKTTVSDILLGLLQPQKGEVLIDGVSIEVVKEQWPSLIGYVPQAVFLLDDTVRANVAFGHPQEDIADEAIWKALEQAQLANFVSSLPNGLDAMVGERGVKFSGGQRQRIAIARALCKNPEILVLDEATAALDNETENAVMESIEALQGTKTLIIIAHRLSTIRNCDRILEIRDGVAIERNKEEVLLNAF